MAGSERRRELRRRRHRKKKISLLASKIDKAGPAERQDIARKIRQLTPGADVLLKALSLK